MKKWICTLMSMVMLLSLLGCGASTEAMTDSVSNGSYGYDYSQDAPANNAPEMSAESPASELPQGRKWIITIDMRAETEDLDALMNEISAHIAELGGYIGGSNIYNGSYYADRRYRHASLTIRVPADQADAFTARVGTLSNVVSSNKTLDDVTLQYVDTESRMKALQIEEARLLALMENAETMADLLEIEARLTDVRYRLESATSQLRVYDNLVDYATISLRIDEVQEYTPVAEETLWQRISGGFVRSLKGLGNFFVELFVVLIVYLPYFAFIAAIVALIVFLCRRSIKKRKAKKPPFPVYPPMPPQPYPPAPPAPKKPEE